MELNTYNGNFILDNFSFSSKDNVSTLKNKFVNNLFLWNVYSDYETYKIEYKGNLIVLFHFFKNKISSIELFSKNNSIEDILEFIGGENKYNWGTVFVNIDIRAGYESVIIKYNLI